MNARPPSRRGLATWAWAAIVVMTVACLCVLAYRNALWANYLSHQIATTTDPATRNDAMARLAALGAQAVPHLAKLAVQGDPTVENLALRALDLLARGDGRHATELLLLDPRTDVVVVATIYDALNVSGVPDELRDQVLQRHGHKRFRGWLPAEQLVVEFTATRGQLPPEPPERTIADLVHARQTPPGLEQPVARPTNTKRI